MVRKLIDSPKMVKFTDCKINIGLDIVGKREDGYHNLVTVMVPVPWHDVLEAVPAAETTLTVLGNDVGCPPEDNLVMRAYRLMHDRYDICPMQLVLQKNIPDGAGLGGGSGDATSTILLLNEMCQLNLPKEEMAQIAGELGSDCPFFVYGQPMLATGTGRTMSPIGLDLRGYHLLIVKRCGISVSTRQAYSGVIPQEPKHPLPELLHLPVAQWQGLVKNDFEDSIFPLFPVLGQIKRRLIETGAAYASMTGSGCAVYGIYADKEQMLSARVLFGDCDTFACSF